MRRRYYQSFELTVFLGEPTPEDEAAIRTLDHAIAQFIRQRVDEFPWPIDVTMTSSVERVEQ